MPVGELFLSAFLSVLFDRLTSKDLWQFLRNEGLDLKIKKWERKLRMIEAVLADAEDKQITSKSVMMWLDDLRDLAYDVEDILDEFATEALARKLKIEKHKKQASGSKVRNMLPVCFRNWSPRAVKYNKSMESAMEDVSRRLEELCQLREELGLREIAGEASSSLSTAVIYQRPPTTCLPTEPAIYGRDQDKDRVIQMLMKEEPGSAKFRVTAIVGMGGLGKTTLAREVYNDTRMKDFKPSAWVCISEDFDPLRISNEILGSMTFSSCDYKVLNVVQSKLKELVTGKKFFLVLDDVWSKDYSLWESLKAPFMSAAKGSKIIVTTRSADVALTMNPGEFYELKLLSDDDCWSLFKSHAFESEYESTFPDIEIIRKRVTEKCKGLPLAAKILGGLLRTKRSEDEWLKVLNSKLWELLDKTEIPTALKLSYYHLPSYLKRCFAYCAVLPKDYEFKKEILIHLWMAEGLLSESNESRSLEDLGNKYFEDLVSRSIFQASSIREDRYILHDLVSDLAQWVSGETCYTSDAIGVNRQWSQLEKLRHYSCVCSFNNGINKYEVLMNKGEPVVHLRTFLSLSTMQYQTLSYIPQMLLYDLLPMFKKLRALSLENQSVTELPESVGQLRHLRLLNLSETMIRRLPESLCHLFNLQVIRLKNCSKLRQLPSKMSNLINLHLLDVRGTQLNEMPLGLRELKFLQILPSFTIGKGSGARVKDLKHLKFLRGKLYISKLENVMYPQETDELILNDKKDIKVLHLEWRPECDDSHNDVAAKHVLDILQPHPDLEELTIKCYNGVEFSNWLGNSVLSNMTILRLENCKRCTSLPSLGTLRTLKELTIAGMKGIKSIGYELYGDGCSEPFQLLESLSFIDLQEWELWLPTMKENDHVQVFPHLRRLSIVQCPKLSGKLPDDLSSLFKLVITGCPELVYSFGNLSNLSELEIDGCNNISCTSQVVFKSLESISLSHIADHHKWWAQLFEKEICMEKAPLQKFQSFTILRQLCIKNCSNLISFPEVCFLTNLNRLEIKKCHALVSLSDGMDHNNPHLEGLMIKRCSSLKFIIKGQPPQSMKDLWVEGCTKLECVFDDIENDAENISTCLLLNSSSSRGQLPAAAKLFLSIFDCSQLTSIYSSGQLPERLYNLIVVRAPKLESVAERFHDTMNLGNICLRQCDNLKCISEEGGLPNNTSVVRIFDCEKLEALPIGVHNLDSLRVLLIKGCSSLKSFTVKGFPTNLTSLLISNNEKMYKAVVEWGFHRLTSLTSLEIEGCEEAESFPQEEVGMKLPPTLTGLDIRGFPKLKYLSSKGFQNLTSLQFLSIKNCPNLTSFPNQGLPSSLLELKIKMCPLLEKECKRDKGKEWSKILHIPCIKIGGRFIYDLEEGD